MTQSLIVGKRPSYYIYPGVTNITHQGLTDHERAKIILEIVKEEFSAKFNDPMDGIYGHTRHMEYTTARQVYFYFCRRRIPGLSLNDIARPFGMDHSTVVNGIKSIQNRIDTQDAYCYDVIVSISKRIL